MTKHKKARRIGLKIILGSAGGVMLGFGTKEILFTYVLPPSLQTPFILLLLGFLLLFAAAKV